MTYHKKKICIVGSGPWGKALAYTAYRAGNAPFILSRTTQTQASVQEPFSIVTDTSHLYQAECITLCLPAQKIPSYLNSLNKKNLSQDIPFMIASKGIFIESKKLMSEEIRQIFPKNPLTVLSGPNFAEEIHRNLPAATTLAYADPSSGRAVQAMFAHERFRIYLNQDMVGVQLCGALKNVLSIACGIVKELGLGENAVATLICRGLAEIKEILIRKGGNSETLLSLAGVGDTLLTCMGSASRNFRFGQIFMQTRSIEKSFDLIGSTVEGYYTTEAAESLCQSLEVEAPIIHALYHILYRNSDPLAELEALMRRPARHE